MHVSLYILFRKTTHLPRDDVAQGRTCSGITRLSCSSMNCLYIFRLLWGLAKSNFQWKPSRRIGRKPYVRRQHGTFLPCTFPIFHLCYHDLSLPQIDFSKDLIAWVKSENYALVDINLFPRPFAASALPTSLVRFTRWYSTELMSSLVAPESYRKSSQRPFNIRLGQLHSVSETNARQLTSSL